MHSLLIRSLLVWILFSNKKGSILFCSTLFPLDKNFLASALLTFEVDILCGCWMVEVALDLVE